MRRAVLLPILLLTLACFAQDDQPTRGPSTRAERDRAIKITHELENDPLSTQLRDDRDWLFQWLQAVPDIVVNVCVDPAEGNGKYRYSRELLMQKMFSSAAYIMETSTRDRNDLSVEAAGVQGALKAYEAIVKRDPEARSKYWDLLLKKRADGTLRDYISNYMETACGSEQTQT